MIEHFIDGINNLVVTLWLNITQKQKQELSERINKLYEMYFKDKNYTVWIEACKKMGEELEKFPSLKIMISYYKEIEREQKQKERQIHCEICHDSGVKSYIQHKYIDGKKYPFSFAARCRCVGSQRLENGKIWLSWDELLKKGVMRYNEEYKIEEFIPYIEGGE